MGTGGTLPTNVKQYLTLYNTAGVIEQHKNIYFVPRTSKIQNLQVGTSVCEMYLSAFNDLVEMFSEYTGIELSGWSPEDRSLVVKGNVDDFRVETEEGHSLNYFIVRRDVYTSETNYSTHYYGFFITNVTQAGRGSVRLTYEPDHFTNVFYLHNKHALTALEISGDYEPFNERMKNCYVERQHYNRVKLENNVVKFDNMDKFFNCEEQFKYRYLERKFRRQLSFNNTYCNLSESVISTIEATDNFDNLSTFIKNLILRICLNFVQVICKNRITSRPWSVNADSLTDTTWTSYEDFYTEDYPSFRGYIDEKENIATPYQVLYFPIFIIPDYLKKYENDINNFKINLNCKLYNFFRKEKIVLENQAFDYNENNLLDFKQFSNIVLQKGWGDMILGMYITQTPYLSNYIKSFNFVSKIITLDVNALGIIGQVLGDSDYHDTINLYIEELGSKPLYKGLWILPFSSNREDVGKSHYVQFGAKDNNHLMFHYKNIQNSEEKYSVLCLSGMSETESIIQLPENVILTSENFKTNYVEPLIEQEPYCFYSLSYIGGIEVPLNKYRYFNTLYGLHYDIRLKYIESNTDAVKIGVIPFYQGTYCYTEGLVLTLSTSLPVESDSYLNFYYQNKAQMKNQFAVNGIEFANNLFQNAVGGGERGSLMQSAGVGGITALSGMASSVGNFITNYSETYMNQKALLADIGQRPNVIKQTGSDIVYDLRTGEYGLNYNYYRIDTLSYNSISKYLERFGYLVNLYDTLHTMDRVGWNFIKVVSFDYEANITIPQEEAIRAIFSDGVTLLHDKTYLTTGHNFETILEE